MAKAAPILTTFDAGELSPIIGGRVDLAKYFNGCRTLENFLPMVQGPAIRRGGTRFVYPTKYGNRRSWLIRFQVSESISYMLEVGHLYIRFYTQRGLLTTGGAPVEVVTPYAESDLAADDGTCRIRVIQSADTMYIFHGSHQPRKLLRVGPESFTFESVSFANGPFKDINITKSNTVTASGETGVVTIQSTASIFSNGNIGSLFYLESSDRGTVKPWAVYQEVGLGDRRRVDQRVYECTAVGIGVGPVTGTLTPIHTEGVAWDGDGIDISDDQRGPIGVQWKYLHSGFGIVRITAVPAANSAIATVVSRIPTDIVPGGGTTTIVTQRDILAASIGSNTSRIDIGLSVGHGFNAGDSIAISGTILSDNNPPIGPDATIDGAYVIYSVLANSITVTAPWPTDYVYSVASVGRVTRTVITVHSESSSTSKWAHALFSAIEGWPEHGAFWRERLVMARARNIALSVTGDFENFSAQIDGEVTADASIVLTLNARQINRIVWIVESNELILGTDGDEWLVGPIQASQAVGPTNVRAERRTSFGSRSIQPVEANGRVLFIQASGRKLRDYIYDYGSDNYASSDVNKLNPEITLSGVVDIAYQQEPHSIVWAARADGLLIGCTYDQEEGRSDVYGWHRQPMINGQVRSIETMPAPGGGADDLWLIVERVINGQTVRYVEYLNPPLQDSDTQSESFYVDCGLTYRGTTPVSTISGITHLEGEEVDILVDGATHPRRAVADGSVTLQVEGSIVHVGLPAPCALQTMRIEAGAANGTAQGKIKRITNPILRLHRSMGGAIGPARDILEHFEFRSPHDSMDQALPLFSGDTPPMVFPNDGERDGYIWYVNDQPLPVTILAIMPISSVNDDR